MSDQKMTSEEAETMLVRLAEHFGERVAPVSRYCEALEAWARASREYYRESGRGTVATVRMMLMKSSLAARLVYGGEKLRTTKCPVHKGVWSGIEPCEHGCDSTGWLPEDPAQLARAIERRKAWDATKPARATPW